MSAMIASNEDHNRYLRALEQGLSDRQVQIVIYTALNE